MQPFFVDQAITASPNPMDAVVIYRAQSMLTRNGKVGPVLPLDDAEQVIRHVESGGDPHELDPRRPTPSP